MVNIYESIYENDRLMNGRTKLFIKSTDDDGTIKDHEYGVAFTPNSTGTMLIVDDWLIPQLSKVVFIDSTLQVRSGEELEEPVKSERELQREELLRQLAYLESDNN